jgi:hypothetical protein
LCDLIEARALLVGAVLAKARDAGQDDPRVQGREGLVIKAQAVFDIGAVVLDHHVGALHQTLQDGSGLGLFQVEGDRAFVAVQIQRVRAVSGTHGALGGIQARRGFDADDIGTEIGQHSYAGGARTHPGQIEDTKAPQGGKASCRLRSGGIGGHLVLNFSGVILGLCF